MSTGRERFSDMLDTELETAKSGSGAFGKLYLQQKAEWVQSQTQQAISDGQTVNSSTQAEFATKFDTEFWDKQQKDALKTKTMSVYDGQSKEATAQNTANQFMDGAGNAVGLGASSFLTGGDFTSGLSHGVRHAALGAIMGIPFVGEFLGQLMAWATSKLTSLFGGGESLSWGEAGEKVERENIKKRFGAEMGQYADVNRLAEMVNESGKEPAPDTSASEQSADDAKRAEEARRAAGTPANTVIPGAPVLNVSEGQTGTMPPPNPNQPNSRGAEGAAVGGNAP